MVIGYLQPQHDDFSSQFAHSCSDCCLVIVIIMISFIGVAACDCVVVVVVASSAPVVTRIVSQI